MPFIRKDISTIIEKKRAESDNFKKTWDESRSEYKLIGEMIKLRKDQKITQSQLAAITGNRQQTISRIEKHESNPSLRIFCNILSALGYELQITKKSK